jgi:hypothetical protein
MLDLVGEGGRRRRISSSGERRPTGTTTALPPPPDRLHPWAKTGREEREKEPWAKTKEGRKKKADRRRGTELAHSTRRVGCWVTASEGRKEVVGSSMRRRPTSPRRGSTPPVRGDWRSEGRGGRGGGLGKSGSMRRAAGYEGQWRI